MAKNIPDWSRELAPGVRAVPEAMRMPLFDVTLSARAWFTLLWLLPAGVFAMLLWRHGRRPVTALPRPWFGRAQLLLVVLLWLFVLGDLARQLPAFRAPRLITEGGVWLSATLATWLALSLPLRTIRGLSPAAEGRRGGLVRAGCIAVVGLIVVTAAATALTRGVYGDRHAGFRGQDYRFGPRANARVRPLLRGEAHR